MATLTHALEALRARRQRGESPAVDVSGAAHEFLSVQFGGTSPNVTLATPAGETVSKTAAQWRALGAEFKARSRNLKGSAQCGSAPAPRRYDVLTYDGSAYQYPAEDAAQARMMHEALHPGDGKRALLVDLVVPGARSSVDPHQRSGAVQREIDRYLSAAKR